MLVLTWYSKYRRFDPITGPFKISILYNLRRPFVKFVDWQHCAAVMQREAVIVMPSCSGGGYVVVV
jgi:hypothetical protein